MSASLSELLVYVADSELILGHRHSEWTGLGPLLEEDIAFSSIAQDKLGHAQALYNLNKELCGGPDADTIAFRRTVSEFRCSNFVELPNLEYDFSLMRHFLFDAAEFLRYGMLATSSVEQLSKLARKVQGEIKYHLYHAKSWVVQLSSAGTEESKMRMQKALNQAWPYALGMFEPGAFDAQLMADGVFGGEKELQTRWEDFVLPIIAECGLSIPSNSTPVTGGRTGKHTEYLAPLLEEMTEVVRIDPSAEW